MKGFQLSSGVILIAIGLFSLQTQLVSAAFTMNETCLYVTKGWIADPNSCQSWGYCNGGKLVGTGACGTGFLYDFKNGNCDYAANVTCSSTVADTCKNLQTPQMVADPNDCSNFCYCDGNGGSECGECPANQFYNPTAQKCVWSSEYSCPADSICRLVPNNKFVGDPDNCGGYISCLDGAGTPSECQLSTQYFNPLNGMCQNLNPCSSDDDNNSPSTDTAGPGVLTPLGPGNYADFCDGSTEEFVSDKVSCMGFYYCPAVDTKNPAPKTVAWNKCPLGSHFKPSLKECVTPYTYKCPYDRCGNINQNYVTKVDQLFIASTACKSYLYCSNQTALKTVTATTTTYSFGTCPVDYPYFDEVQGSCINSALTYAICEA